MTIITQVFNGPRRGTFVALIIDTDKSTNLVDKYAGKFKYVYPIPTRFVNAIIASQWQLMRSKQGVVPSEDLYAALADAAIHPGLNSLVEPVVVVNLDTVLFEYRWHNRRPSRVDLYKYLVPRFPEDPDSFQYRYIARDPNRPQLTAQQCDALYMDVNEKRNFRYSYLYPKSHPLYLAALAPIADGFGSDRIIYTSNSTEMPEQLWSNITDNVRYRLCTKLIPMMGRGVFRDTPSRFGYKQKLVPIRDSNDNRVADRYVRVHCTETRPDGTVCGGSYLPTRHGDYACDRCGIIYVQNDIAVRRVQQSSSIAEAFGEVPDEDDGGFEEDVPYSDADTRAAEREYLESQGVVMPEPVVSVSTSDEDSLPPEDDITPALGGFNPDIDGFANIIDSNKTQPQVDQTGLEYYGQGIESDFRDEVATVPVASNNIQLGTDLPQDLQRVDSRINDNLLIWKTSLIVPPEDEIEFQKHLARIRAADREMRRKLRNAKLAEERKYHRGYSIYLNRWRKYAREFAEYRVLHAIRSLGITVQADIVRYFNAKQDSTRQAGKRRINTFVPLQQEQVRRAIQRLVERKRIIREDNNEAGLNHAKIVVNLTYVPYIHTRQVPRRAVYVDPTVNHATRLSREPNGLYTHDIHWSLDEFSETHPL